MRLSIPDTVNSTELMLVQQALSVDLAATGYWLGACMRSGVCYHLFHIERLYGALILAGVPVGPATQLTQ